MFAWTRTAKRQKLEQCIVGKKARLAACKDLAEQVRNIPSEIALQMMELPEEIAQLEKQLEHLNGSNDGGKRDDD